MALLNGELKITSIHYEEDISDETDQSLSIRMQ